MRNAKFVHCSMGTTLGVYIHTTPLILSGIVDLVGQCNGPISLLHNSQMLQSKANRETCLHWVSVHILSVSNISHSSTMGMALLSISQCVSQCVHTGKQVVQSLSTLEKHIWEHYTKSYTKTSIATSLKCLVMPQTYINTSNQAYLIPLEFNTQTYA